MTVQELVTLMKEFEKADELLLFRDRDKICDEINRKLEPEGIVLSSSYYGEVTAHRIETRREV